MERFEFVCNLGEGAYGTVWKCLDKETGLMVAMKRFKEAHLDEEVMHLALREIKLLKACSHPNVVHLHEAFKSKSGRVYMVMEHVEFTMTQELKRNPRGLMASKVKLITWQLLQATASLHSNKIIHRDLKPANILLTDADVVKVCDFGFARPLTHGEDGDYTQYVVTRWYRPPELLVGATYGPPVDVWAIGCLFAELATGRPMFPGQDTLDQLWLTMRTLGELPAYMMDRIAESKHLSQVPIPTAAQVRTLEMRYPELSPEMFEVLHSCLALDPSQRLSALEVMSLPYFDDMYDVLDGTDLLEQYDHAYENACSSKSPNAHVFYQTSSGPLRKRADGARLLRPPARDANGTISPMAERWQPRPMMLQSTVSVRNFDRARNVTDMATRRATMDHHHALESPDKTGAGRSVGTGMAAAAAAAAKAEGAAPLAPTIKARPGPVREYSRHDVMDHLLHSSDAQASRNASRNAGQQRSQVAPPPTDPAVKLPAARSRSSRTGSLVLSPTAEQHEPNLAAAHGVTPERSALSIGSLQAPHPRFAVLNKTVNALGKGLDSIKRPFGLTGSQVKPVASSSSRSILTTTAASSSLRDRRASMVDGMLQVTFAHTPPEPVVLARQHSQSCVKPSLDGASDSQRTGLPPALPTNLTRQSSSASMSSSSHLPLVPQDGPGTFRQE